MEAVVVNLNRSDTCLRSAFSAVAVRHTIVKAIVASYISCAILGVDIAVGLLRAKIVKSVIFYKQKFVAAKVRQVIPRSVTVSLASPCIVPH
jgi:hypothetical protein